LGLQLLYKLFTLLHEVCHPSPPLIVNLGLFVAGPQSSFSESRGPCYLKVIFYNEPQIPAKIRILSADS